ncbi:His-Xaa-Ser system radical SAM maturase HxsB [Komagataeibacter xylinus]|uniref:His-Xaa-Ser system radical SAM maturase HxsB n=1 Tax=Komagataeibacter xylinus TaxID=28448 RepID=A0A318PF34_KOMXY|nr:His-Xaa-Ser system radical SAM maturase HxsB [Komagataeibacter xylinus]PYD55614.1 His-Xaa-Ser system radical SAM maturase HxsB [Komagataeibacter xylinus]GBQ75114.1 radical SAM domain-containing protein [Komagataeibacter xylinus NBRC 15237]
MVKFLSQSDFFTQKEELVLLPFRFERMADGRFIISNLLGDMDFFTEDELNKIVNKDIFPGDGLYERAFSLQFIANAPQEFQLQTLAARLRSRLQFLQTPTPLHIFVVTLRCEHSCPYCQVSRRSCDKQLYDMPLEIAFKGVDVAFQTPSPAIKIEFQGGEPLLNFSLIKEIVLYSERKSSEIKKYVSFVMTTNLALMDDNILSFCKHHNVHISTSLDGPESLHNKNRPRPGGNSYQLAKQNIQKIQKEWGNDYVSALMTTTEASLSDVKGIIDEYVNLNLGGIFLRPLSPYGFAIKTKYYKKYDDHEWFDFYKKGLSYILDINKKGKHFPEFYTALILKRLLTDIPTGYVDLRSPSGIGLGALIYNYDGKVYAADEGRMLAEMGDHEFLLGDIKKDDYFDIILSEKLISIISKTLTQCAPQCKDCVFEPVCGADPVYHYATQKDVLGIKSLSKFCSRQKNVISYIVNILQNDPEDAKILRSWIR